MKFCDFNIGGKQYRVYSRTFEIQLTANVLSYPLDKYQSMNNKRLYRLVVPNYCSAILPLEGGGSDYVVAPQSIPSGFPLAPTGTSGFPEIIDGAYLKLMGNNNQLIRDGEPLNLYRNDGALLADKGIFADFPLMDWTQSSIVYPTTAIPNAYSTPTIGTSLSFLVIAYYLDTPEGIIP